MIPSCTSSFTTRTLNLLEK